MQQHDFKCSLTADVTASQALEGISRVSEWWSSDFEGRARDAGDIFTVRFGETFVTFKIVDAVPGAGVAWKVLDSRLPWLADDNEWNGTTVCWNVSSKGDATEVTLTHVGLVPEIECYERCKEGWTFFATESLAKFMADGKGLPNRRPNHESRVAASVA